MSSGVHANRVARTSLDTHAAIDAAQRIDLITDRVLLDRITRVLSGLDIDTVGGASRRAEKARGAVGGVIRAESQTVTAAKRVRVRNSFFGVLHRDIGLTIFRQTEGMENMNAKIAPEVVSG